MTRVGSLEGTGVIVVGGGATGLLVARHLAESGSRVLLVDRYGIAGGQSAHWHGYLHRGYIYLKPEDKLVTRLPRSAAKLEELTAVYGIAPITNQSVIAVPSMVDLAHALRAWDIAGLTGHRVLTPGEPLEDVTRSRLTTDFQLVSSPEKTIDFSQLATAIVTTLPDNMFYVRGDVVGIHDSSSGRVTGINVEVESSYSTTLAADRYIFAAGCGLPPMIANVRGHYGELTLRLSFMLVLRHPDLPLISCAFPGDTARGMFVASRPSNNNSAHADTVWLVSNHLSFTDLQYSEAARLWLEQIVRTLDKHTNILALDGLQWGYYPALKAEHRGELSTLEGSYFDPLGWTNAAVAIPTKLTLIPDLIDQVDIWMQDGPAARDTLDTAGMEMSVPLVMAETWRSCIWYERDHLVAFGSRTVGPEVPVWWSPTGGS